MRHYTVSVPKTRDPFVNTKLISVGTDPATGEERFWSSTWNGIDGSTGALVTPSGKNKVFHFDPKNEEFGFYGAAYDGENTLWMTCFTDKLFEFNINTGEIKKYLTGVPNGLTSSGLTYDMATKKVFYSAYNQDTLKQKGLVFDTVTKQVIKVFEDIPVKNTQQRNAIKNLDGTYTYLQLVPDLQIFTWDPKTDLIAVLTEPLKLGYGEEFHNYVATITREDGAVYLTHFGWFDPLKKGFVDGPHPSIDMCWFGRNEQYVYGAKSYKLGNSVVYRWCLETGETEAIAEVPDVMRYAFHLSKTGKIVCINLYGFLYTIDAISGSVESVVRLDSDARGHIDCVWRIDDERLLCTPFITQRFYEINVKTNTAVDLGRATGGVGEVLQICELDGKVYMSSYTKGQLVAFDPTKPAHFPENPTIVAEPPSPAMRPVGMVTDGKSIYYSISHEYGLLGSMMIQYTPGAPTVVVDNPIPNHMIRSLYYDETRDRIVAATSYNADCTSAPPVDKQGKITILDKDTLLPVKEAFVDSVYGYPNIIGEMGDGTYLMTTAYDYLNCDQGCDFSTFNAESFSITPFCFPQGLDSSDIKRIFYTKKPGMFIICGKTSITLWDLQKGEQKAVLSEEPIAFYNGYFQKGSLYLMTDKQIHIFEEIL